MKNSRTKEVFKQNRTNDDCPKIFWERKGGNGGKERAIGPFFSPVAVL